MRTWLLWTAGFVLLDAVLYVVVMVGTSAENCDSLRPEAGGSDWACSGMVQALAARPGAVLGAALAVTALAPVVLAARAPLERRALRG